MTGMTLLRSALTAFALVTIMTAPVWAEMAPIMDDPATEEAAPASQGDAVEKTPEPGPADDAASQAQPATADAPAAGAEEPAAAEAVAAPEPEAVPTAVTEEQDAPQTDAAPAPEDMAGQKAIADFAAKARADAEKMYEAMDVVGYMVFDQQGRSCAADSKAKEKLCMMIQDDFLAVMAREDFQADCHARAVDMLVNTLDPHTIAYGAAYHEAVDHKRVKAIINAPDYKRDDLKAYMDGALQEVAAKGFNPAETKTRERVQRIRKDVMALCAQLVGQYSRHNPDEPADEKAAAEPAKESAPE